MGVLLSRYAGLSDRAKLHAFRRVKDALDLAASDSVQQRQAALYSLDADMSFDDRAELDVCVEDYTKTLHELTAEISDLCARGADRPVRRPPPPAAPKPCLPNFILQSKSKNQASGDARRSFKSSVTSGSASLASEGAMS